MIVLFLMCALLVQMNRVYECNTGTALHLSKKWLDIQQLPR